MTIQKDVETRFNLNILALEPLASVPSNEIDGDVSYIKTDAAHGNIRLAIGGTIVKIYEDGTISNGPDTTVKTILSSAKVV